MSFARVCNASTGLALGNCNAVEVSGTWFDRKHYKILLDLINDVLPFHTMRNGHDGPLATTSVHARLKSRVAGAINASHSDRYSMVLVALTWQ